MCCSISFPLFASLNSAIHVDIIFMLFTLQSCVKPMHIKNETWNFLFFSISKPKVYSPIPCFFFVLCSISHAFANPLCFLKRFLCFDGPYTVFILIYPHCNWFLLYPFYKVYLLRRSFLPCSTHTCTPFSNTIMNKTEWLKSKNVYNVSTDWWKLVKKSRMKWEKNELCGYLQWTRHGRSWHWVRKIPANQNTGNIEGNSVFRAIVVASW